MYPMQSSISEEVCCPTEEILFRIVGVSILDRRTSGTLLEVSRNSGVVSLDEVYVVPVYYAN